MNYFPTHLATGLAFCNRKKELERIHHDLGGNSPVLLISPRRYGKTSLALKSFEKIDWPFAHIDLFKALSEEDIERYILNGIGQLLGKLESVPKKLLNIASDFFSALDIMVVMEKSGIKLEINKRKKNIQEVILKSLENLHQLAVKKNRKVALFMDEFQVVGEATANHTIEAAIREAAQKSTHVSYVFSGSNRHLMEQMFYDRKRPFYKLCDQIKLDRISEEDYELYIQHASIKNWNEKINENSIDVIFEITERHPYYVNKLCSLLWQLKKPPLPENAYFAWNQFVLENKSSIERELQLLSINQRKLMIFIANQNMATEIFGKKTSYNANLAPSSIQRAVEPLIEKDYVYVDNKKFYRILDPLIKSVLCI